MILYCNCFNSFYCYDKTYDGYLFLFGGFNGDIVLYKENRKSESWCCQGDYEYPSETPSLCSNGNGGRTSFTPKRFIVIQMN